ncbi:helix-turn-helix domain-containing protein [Actinoplanes teichomyceticus]|uniref:MarR family protein n=1 Tax=Actinoplanes teichomyceticus TaxID=1867 RepID=A0A561VRE5_ACTTI|nr:helix-turn-helix domain-containing protein [Actinoplanes teichomyceticus]TWG14192.1 MarR family protein [Actinoplanes teichomyceticus]
MIGLVVHAAHRARFADAARTLTGVTFAWAVYEHEHEIRDRVASLLREHRPDGLLLGLVPYARSRDLIPDGLPVRVTRSAALDLALAWARARGNGWPATPVSIDTFASETVDEVAAALDLDRTAIASLPFEPDQPVADVVAFHREHLERTGAPYVISGRMGVAAALDGRTAVLHALATPGTIRADLHELALRIRNKRADAQRFAAGLFLVAGPPHTGPDRARAGLQHLLGDTPEFADAWIDRRGARGVLVLAPASLFEAVTRQWVGLPVLAEARDTLGVRVVAGFGIGGSARLSVTLAERAAARAEQDAEPGAYLFTGDGMTIGPMGVSAVPLTYTYREHGGLEELAGRAGLSAATLSRLAAVERGLDGRPLSPGELARTLGITDPSGRRLIRKLTGAGLVAETGSAQEHRKGRPSRLYRLAITRALEAGR